jgi:hypothetical protein
MNDRQGKTLQWVVQSNNWQWLPSERKAMEEEQQKIGAGHAKAMFRQGFKELAQALPAFPSHGIQPVEEPGLAGNLTPQEITADKAGYESVLEAYAQRGREVEPQKEQEVER